MERELTSIGNKLLARRSQFDLSRPSDDARSAHIESTKAALDRLISKEADQREPRLASGKRNLITASYKPSGTSNEHQLSIVDQQNDPLEPPRHKYRKPKPFDKDVLSLASTDTRAPILRPKAAKLSKEQKEEWNIPSSISNWKNGRGFLIDLDQRSKTSVKPETASNDNKQASLAQALAQATNEVSQETHQPDSIDTEVPEEPRIDEESKLRQKLLDQRDKKRKASETDNNIFDTRLFRAGSKPRQDPYDSTLFGNRARPKADRNHHVEFEP